MPGYNTYLQNKCRLSTVICRVPLRSPDMYARRILITIDDGRNDNSNIPCPISEHKLVIGGSVDAVDPLVDEEFNMRMKAVINKVAALHGESPKRCQTVTMVQRRRKSPFRSTMPPLPYPPRHNINKAWKKPPSMLKLTVCTKPGTVTLTWDDGISPASYHLYESLDGYELFACILDGDVNNAKWEKLIFISALAPSQSRRVPIECKMTKMARGIEYYFAVRAVDVHNRRGPCAVVYARP